MLSLGMADDKTVSCGRFRPACSGIVLLGFVSVRSGLGCRGHTSIMENHMEKSMDNRMDTGLMEWYMRITCFVSTKHPSNQPTGSRVTQQHVG